VKKAPKKLAPNTVARAWIKAAVEGKKPSSN
jgi:hypothetical protein